MPDVLYWPLFVTFFAAAIASIYKMVEANHAKKLADDECVKLRKQLDEFTPKGAEAVNEVKRTERPGYSSAEEDILFKVLARIAELHSQNIPATPTELAPELGIDAELLLAHMWMFHNEQYVTFSNGGMRPEVGTAFFLSPKAWQHIKITKA